MEPPILPPAASKSHTVLACWTYSEDTQICASNVNDTVMFEVVGNRSRIPEVALRNIRGWIPPEDIESNTNLIPFYQRFIPVLIDASTLILCLIDTEIKDREEKKPSRMLVSVEQQNLCLRILFDQNLYVVSGEFSKHDVIQDINKSLENKVNEQVINRIINTKEIFNFFAEKEIKENLKSNSSSLDIMELMQKLIGEDHLLEGGETVLYYGMPHQSFVNMKKENDLKVTFNPKAPDWCIIHPGLNLKGTCNNASCKAKGQAVWTPCGFGTFDLRKAIQAAVCPCCVKTLSNVLNSGFYKCIFTIKASTKNDYDEVVSRIKEKTPENKLLTFKDNEERLLKKYEFVKIITEPLSESCTLS